VRSEPAPGPLPAGRIGAWHRAALTVAGLASWLAGGAASFLGSNGLGAAALIAVGGICGMLGLMGRWPSRISMSGNEVIWETIEQTVSSQIQVAVDNDESETVLAELTTLRSRLAELQRSGIVPSHPAQIYDDDVAAAIRRLLPQAEIIRQQVGDRATPDFIVRYRRSMLFAETKWRADPARAFGGSTLPPLIHGLKPDARLLVITNTSVPPLPSAYQTLRQALGDRGRIVEWLDPADDASLAEALAALLPGTALQRGQANP
jgi:hypothetical protein